MLQYNKEYQPVDGLLRDIYDGLQYKRLQEVHNTNDVDNIIYLSLCYDGVDLFKSGSDKGKMTVLSISILNFGFEYRLKPGIGLLVNIFNLII